MDVRLFLPDHRDERPTGPLCARGLITLVTGCMFSGKTTELLRQAERLPAASVAAFKHTIDTRYDAERIVSHAGKAMAARPVAHASDIAVRRGDGVQLVAIDEAHFFGASLEGALRQLASDGMDVIVTALDLDSWGRPFALVERLRDLADEAIVTTGTCARCGTRATRTQRLTPIVDGRMVGGAESYEPRCPRCWSPPLERPSE